MGLKPKGKGQSRTDVITLQVLEQAILLRREVPSRSVAGPYLPIGPNGALRQVYLVTFVDDATRFVLHGVFYSTLDQIIVEDSFRTAIQKYGVPESVYFDNGKQYRTK